MLARARSVQFVRYLWVIPVLSLCVILAYFYYDGPTPNERDTQVISLGALQTVLRREVDKMLDNVIIPQPNSKTFPDVKLRPDSEKLRILVTGGAGFVGSHLVDRLMMDGHYVIVLDNYFTGSPDNLEQWVGHRNYQFIRHDIIEPISLEVDQIYHLACPASPVHYRVDPIKTIMTNTRGTIHMLGLAKRVNARMLLASSSDVYGDPSPENHPQKETYWGYVNPDGPRACYDEGKRVAETMMYAYQNQANVDVRVARIFNTYGPRMHPDDGRVISNFITQALQGKDITIQGTGTQTRSFQYIDDLVEGLIKLMNGDYSQPVNLGNPQELTIKEIADKVLNVVKTRTSTLKYLPGTVDDPSRRKPDVSLAAQVIGWRPLVDIDEGLQRTVDYFRKAVSTPHSAVMFKQQKD